MRALWPLLTAVLLLQGCGGGGSSSGEPTVVLPSDDLLDENVTQGDDNTTQDNNSTPPDAELPPALPVEDAYFAQQWNLEYDAGFYAAHSIDGDANIHPGEALQRFGGRGVTVVVIDDGVDVFHEDLDSAVDAAYDLETGTGDVSHRSSDSGYHGTAVTGIAAARANSLGIRGVASAARVIFLRHKSVMSDSDWITLFNKAEELGADVINCSWGTYDVFPLVKSTIQDLARNGRNGKGLPIVFAAGNDDVDMGNDESAIPEVIAVGATQQENVRADYSNYGPELDVMAPGGYPGVIGIPTLDPMGSDGVLRGDYFLAQGTIFAYTSAAAPTVTGVIAILLEVNPELTREQIMEILAATSDKIGPLAYDGDGRNDYYGYGKINLSRAVSMALGQ